LTRTYVVEVKQALYSDACFFNENTMINRVRTPQQYGGAIRVIKKQASKTNACFVYSLKRYYLATGASTGQTLAQAPQSMQEASSIT